MPQDAPNWGMAGRGVGLAGRALELADDGEIEEYDELLLSPTPEAGPLRILGAWELSQRPAPR